MSATVSTSPATCYTVRNGWAWAHIFVQHGMAQEERGPRYWVHVSILSDYGDFGYCWSHIGERWQAFLAGISFDYAMQKMMGPRFSEHLSLDDCKAKARELVLDRRRNDGLTKTEARELWDAVDDTDENYPVEAFLCEWDRASSGAMYRNDLWDGNWKQPAPAAVGFWSEIWPHFTAAITAESAQVAA